MMKDADCVLVRYGVEVEADLGISLEIEGFGLFSDASWRELKESVAADWHEGTYKGYEVCPGWESGFYCYEEWLECFDEVPITPLQYEYLYHMFGTVFGTGKDIFNISNH